MARAQVRYHDTSCQRPAPMTITVTISTDAVCIHLLVVSILAWCIILIISRK